MFEETPVTLLAGVAVGVDGRDDAGVGDHAALAVEDPVAHVSDWSGASWPYLPLVNSNVGDCTQRGQLSRSKTLARSS